MSDKPLYMMNDLTEDELELIRMDRENRAAPRVSNRRRKQPAEPQPKPRAPLVDRLVMIGAGLLVVLMLVLGGFKLAEYVAAYRGAIAETQPTAHPAQPPASAPTYHANVVSNPAPVAAPQPTQAPAYALTVPPGMMAGWQPGERGLDVTGRAYRELARQGASVEIELDDGTRLWVTGAQAPVAPTLAPTLAAPIGEIAPTPGPVDTWGPGGTSGGSTWGEPTAQPLQNAIIPAMPHLEIPTPAWGEGGSSGGATW